MGKRQGITDSDRRSRRTFIGPRLADIREEDSWLAKQKSKCGQRVYKLDVQHFMRHPFLLME
jgi:hypothetical protein